MDISSEGMDFEDSLGNGDRAIKLLFQRARSDKVRQIKPGGKNDVIIENKKTSIMLFVM